MGAPRPGVHRALGLSASPGMRGRGRLLVSWAVQRPPLTDGNLGMSGPNSWGRDPTASLEPRCQRIWNGGVPSNRPGGSGDPRDTSASTACWTGAVLRSRDSTGVRDPSVACPAHPRVFPPGSPASNPATPATPQRLPAVHPQGVERAIPVTCEAAGLRQLSRHPEATNWSLQRMRRENGPEPVTELRGMGHLLVPYRHLRPLLSPQICLGSGTRWAPPHSAPWWELEQSHPPSDGGLESGARAVSQPHRLPEVGTLGQ